MLELACPARKCAKDSAHYDPAVEFQFYNIIFSSNGVFMHVSLIPTWRNNRCVVSTVFDSAFMLFLMPMFRF